MQALWFRAVAAAPLVFAEVLSFEAVTLVCHLAGVPVTDLLDRNQPVTVEAMVGEVLARREVSIDEDLFAARFAGALWKFEVFGLCLCPHVSIGWVGQGPMNPAMGSFVLVSPQAIPAGARPPPM